MWTRKVSRAEYAAIAAMIASPSVNDPTVHTTFDSIASAAARQVWPEGSTTSGANFFSTTHAVGAGPTSAA